MGVHLVNPDQPVVGITGDGGLNMTIGELETARRAGAPITSIVVNNAASGYVKSLQHAIFDGRYQSSDPREFLTGGHPKYMKQGASPRWTIPTKAVRSNPTGFDGKPWSASL